MTLPAVRTVDETDDYRIVEGLAFPFRGTVNGKPAGRDTYGTFFSARTDFVWDYFDDVLPLKAGARSAAAEPRYVRPLNFHHGLDDIGLFRAGGWSPLRVDDAGVWVRARIEKRQRYYEDRIKPLLDAGALGLSGDSASHLVNIDERSGEIRAWPAYGVALTYLESNPLAQLAVRSAAGAEEMLIRIVSPDAAVRGWLPEGTTQGDLDDGDFAWLADDKTLPDSERRKLPYKIHGKVNEAGWKAAWSRANQEGTDFSGGPSRAAVLKKLKADKPADVELSDNSARSALRAIQTFADIQASAEMNEELPEAFDTLQASIFGAIWALDPDGQPYSPDDKRTAIGDSLEQFRTYILAVLDRAGRSAPPMAARAGKRNSSADQRSIDSIHDSSVALGATAHATNSDAGDDDAARSAETQPVIRISASEAEPQAVRVDVEAVTQALRPLIADAVRARLEALRSD